MNGIRRKLKESIAAVASESPKEGGAAIAQALADAGIRVPPGAIADLLGKDDLRKPQESMEAVASESRVFDYQGHGHLEEKRAAMAQALADAGICVPPSAIEELLEKEDSKQVAHKLCCATSSAEPGEYSARPDPSGTRPLVAPQGEGGCRRGNRNRLGWRIPLVENKKEISII